MSCHVTVVTCLCEPEMFFLLSLNPVYSKLTKAAQPVGWSIMESQLEQRLYLLEVYCLLSRKTQPHTLACSLTWKGHSTFFPRVWLDDGPGNVSMRKCTPSFIPWMEDSSSNSESRSKGHWECFGVAGPSMFVRIQTPWDRTVKCLRRCV